MWGVALKSTLITVPVTVAVLDVFGYVARVEGASMQVSSFSTKTKCLIVSKVYAPLTVSSRRHQNCRRYSTVNSWFK